MKPRRFPRQYPTSVHREEYLKSLQDGREIYIYGERVKDVYSSGTFRNAAASCCPAVRRAAQTGDAGLSVLEHRHRQRRLCP